MNRNLQTIDSEVETMAGYWRVSERGHSIDYDLRLLPGGKDFIKGPFGIRLPSTFKGPWLRPIDKSVKNYPVLRHRDVLFDFLQIATRPEEKNILSFADKWGLLGGSIPVIDVSDNIVWAEPLLLWEKESRFLETLWQIWSAVRSLSTKGMGIEEHRRANLLLQDRVMWTSDNRVIFRWPEPISHQEVIAFRATNEGSELLERWKPGDTREPARFFVHNKINHCLRGHVHMGVATFQSSKIRFVPDSLRTAIYMHFAFELAGIVGNERTCLNPSCPNGRAFFPNRRNQKHCDNFCQQSAGYHRRENEKRNSRSNS